MDIEKLLTVGEWLEVPGVQGYAKFGGFKLKIILSDPLEYIDLLNEIEEMQKSIRDKNPKDALNQAATMVNRILALVVEWNFEAKDQPVPCTIETKVLYLRRLLFQRVMKDDGTPTADSLMSRIIRFSGDIESALKN